MSVTKVLTSDGLLYLWSKIKAGFVAKDGTKVLSTNDYTTTEKDKLSNIAANANNYSLPTATGTVLGGVKVDGSTVTINNGVISANGGVTFSRVVALPGTGLTGIIYLVPNTGATGNVYDEFIWCDVNGSGTMGFEKIGTTAIDLSGYMLKTDIVAVTNAEIDVIVAS